LGVGVLLAFCSTLLKKSIKGGLIVMGGLNLGGALDPVYSAISIAELAIEKGAETLLIPISARRQLYDLSDEIAMKINITYYSDAKSSRYKLIYQMALATGMRQSEILGFKWEDVEWTRSTINVKRQAQDVNGKSIVFSRAQDSCWRKADSIGENHSG